MLLINLASSQAITVRSKFIIGKWLDEINAIPFELYVTGGY
jgi:hypothetical protein